MFTSRLLMVWRWALLILILGLMAKENGSAQSTPTLLRKIGLGTLTYSVLSPDGTKILTCGTDACARLWDSATGQLLWSKQYYDLTGCTIVGFSIDGKKMITGSRVLDVWDVVTKYSLGKLNGSAIFVDSITFSADGKTVVTGSQIDSLCQTWDLGSYTSLKTINSYETRFVRALACSPDGSQVLIDSIDAGLNLVDTHTGKALRRSLVSMTRGRQLLSFSPDGKSFAAGVYPNNKVQVLNTSMTQVLATYSGHSGPVNAVAFSADGARLVSGSADGTARLWDVTTSQTIRVFSGHADAIENIGMSTDKKKIMTGSDDQTVRIWNADTGTVQQTLADFLPGQGPVCISPDGKTILFYGSGKQWCLRDVATGQVIRKYDVKSLIGRNAIFSPDGTKILTANYHEADVWDAKTGQLLHTLKGHTDNISCYAFSPDSSQVLTGSFDNTARLWDIATSKTLQTYSGYPNGSSLMSAALAPDGKRIATGGYEGIITIRNTATGAVLQQIPVQRYARNTVTSLAFSRDGTKLLAGYENGEVRLWDASNGNLLNTLRAFLEVTTVAFSPDGSKVLAGSSDYKARLWDTSTGDLLQTYSGQRDKVFAAFSPDGNKVLTSSSDGTVWLWSTMPTQAREWSRYE